MTLKKALSFFLAMLMLLSVTACGKKDSAQEDEQGGGTKDSLVARINLQLSSMDPTNPPNGVSIVVAQQMYEGLVRLETTDSGLITDPCLATDWTISEDGREYTFFLREGVLFHNGNPFTAEDVKFSMEHILEGTTVTFFIRLVSSIEVVDDYTVKMTLSEPSVAFLGNLANIPIVDKETCADGTFDLTKNANGTGPYKLIKFDEANQTISMEAYESYWGEKAPIKNLQLKAIIDSTAAALALQSGDVDYCMNLDANSCLTLESANNIVVETAPKASLTYAMFNCSIEPTSNKALRQAISYAIDKEAITMIVSDGYNRVADEFQYPGTIGYEPKSVSCYEYNPEKAREILAEAGLENVEISFISDRDYVAKFAEVIQSNLRDVGITLSIEQLDASGYDEKVYGKLTT